MTLTKIINAKSEEMDSAAKLVAIGEKVAKARAAYGNEEAEISVPEVNTANGFVSIEYLSDGDKVAVAAAAIEDIRMIAIETTKDAEGVMLDKEIERLLATSSVLCNLTATSGSDYI